LWALAFVLLIGLLQRDFGPMLAAERRMLQQPTAPSRPSISTRIGKANGWWNAVLPVVITVLAVLILLYQTGLRAAIEQTGSPSVSLWMIFGAADSYFSLLWGSLSGLVTAVVLVRLQRLLTWNQLTRAIRYGAELMMPALVVLWLASALSAMTGHDPLPDFAVTQGETASAAHDYPHAGYRLYTGEYLASLLDSSSTDSAAPDGLARWLPTIIFLLAAGISFATGTSWGTMAIVMPVAIPLAYAAVAPLGELAWQEHPIAICTIGSVLAGAIFGDHCSPISDTTVLSSQACGCEHTAHVWTQLPYAALVAVVSIAMGTLPVGWGLPVGWLLPLGFLTLGALLLLLGRPTGDADVTSTGTQPAPEPPTDDRDLPRDASYH
jgi:Na+/H+ antiporter NhaC